MPETQIIQESPRLIRLTRRSFFSAGQDGFTQPPAQNPDLCETFENFLPPLDGVLRKRWGMSRFDSGTAVSIAAQNISEYRKDDGSKNRLVLSGVESATRKVKSCNAAGSVQNTGIFTVSSTTDNPRQVTSRDSAYFASGTLNDQVKWDGNDTAGSGTSTWGFNPPLTAPSAASSGSGTMTITSFRDYTVAFKNTATNHISDIGPFVRVTAFANKAQVDLTSVPLGVTAIGGINTGINQRLILATSDGGARTRLYLVGTIADNTTTTFTDTVAEATLLTNAVYVEIDDSDGLNHGILNNARPPAGKYPIKHRGRLYMLVDRKLRFSKNIVEVSTSSGFEIGGRYEECWPADYEIDVSSIAQDPVGLLSDGAYLYILAKSGFYRLSGDGPLTFRPPELIFRYLGVQSQDAIDTVYQGGVPVGMLWVTPDKQVVFSDGNTYDNLTWPVKPEMDAIPEANLNNIRVKYASYQGHNLGLVAIPQSGATIPTLVLVYNLDLGKWGRFTLPATQEVTAFHFWHNPTTSLPQILWCVDDAKLYCFDAAQSTDLTSADATATFTATFQAAWQDFGAPHIRKHLNEMELDGSVSNIAVTIAAATTDSEFTSPTSIVSAVTAVTSPLADKKVYLAGKSTKDRFYRPKFAVSGNLLSSVVVLRAFHITAVPLHSQ